MPVYYPSLCYPRIRIHISQQLRSNKELEQVPFFQQVNNLINTLESDDTNYLIWGGDFNCSLTSSDVDGGNYQPKIKSIECINNI